MSEISRCIIKPLVSVMPPSHLRQLIKSVTLHLLNDATDMEQGPFRSIYILIK